MRRKPEAFKVEYTRCNTFWQQFFLSAALVVYRKDQRTSRRDDRAGPGQGRPDQQLGWGEGTSLVPLLLPLLLA